VPSQLHSGRDALPAPQRVPSHFDYQLCKHNSPLRNEELVDHKQTRCLPKVKTSKENATTRLWRQSDVAKLHQVQGHKQTYRTPLVRIFSEWSNSIRIGLPSKAMLLYFWKASCAASGCWNQTKAVPMEPPLRSDHTSYFMNPCAAAVK